MIADISKDGFLVLSEKLLDHLFLLNEKNWIFGDDTKEDWIPYIGTYVYIIFGNGKCPKSEEDILKLTPEINSGLDVYRFKDAIREAILSLNDFKEFATVNIESNQLNNFAVAAVLAVNNKMSIKEQSNVIAKIAQETEYM
jgi:hypothetical protein